MSYYLPVLPYTVETYSLVNEISRSSQHNQKFISGRQLCPASTFLDILLQWFSNCASFQFSKGVAGYFGFVSLSLGAIASKEL